MLIEIEKEQARAANLTLVNLQNALKAVTMKDLAVPQFDDSYLTQVFAADDQESVKQFTNIREVITAKVCYPRWFPEKHHKTLYYKIKF